MNTMAMDMIIKAEDPAISNGTSFYGHVFVTTPQRLIDLFGPAECSNNDGEDKTNFEWTLMIGDLPFTVYDWKEYRSLRMEEKIEWHIGAHSSFVASMALSAIARTI
jgi:hypothetical protein